VTKVVGIDTKPKPVDSCQFCGHIPACPALTCPKVVRFELFEDGTIAAVEFFEPDVWKPRPEGDETPE
jgi:hypothetical protein